MNQDNSKWVLESVLNWMKMKIQYIRIYELFLQTNISSATFVTLNYSIRKEVLNSWHHLPLYKTEKIKANLT